MSRLISPRDAEAGGLTGFGGEVCDFLKDMAVSCSNKDIKKFNIKDDEFYSEVFETMDKAVKEMYI
jgi:hypothetical protein